VRAIEDAGTNGNINFISLPGGFQLGFTGMKVLKNDGSQHHGVGIHATRVCDMEVGDLRKYRPIDRILA